MLTNYATIWIAFTTTEDVVAAKSKEWAIENFVVFHGYSPSKVMSIPYFPEVDGFGNKIVRPK